MAGDKGRLGLLKAATATKTKSVDLAYIDDAFETAGTILEVEPVVTFEEPKMVKGLKSVVEQKPEVKNEELVGKKPNAKMFSTETVTKDIFTNEEVNGEESSVYTGEVVTARRNGKEIKARYALNFEGFNDDEIRLSRAMTPYDREVYDAVASLYAAGNRLVSPAMIYRAMHLDESNAYVNKATTDEIVEILKKMAFTKITIDMSEEVLAFLELDGFQTDGYLLAAEKTTITYKGVTADYWSLLREPILLSYAKLKGQVYILPKSVVRIRTNKARTKKSTIIQGYLTDRMIRMKKNSNLSKTILLESMYDYVERSFPNDKRTVRKDGITRQIATEILDEWKEVNFISGYEIKKSGRKLRSIEITLPENKIPKVVIE